MIGYTGGYLQDITLMSGRIRYLFLTIPVLVVLCSCSGDDRNNALIIDEAAILTDISESLHAHLEVIRDEYGIEVVLAAMKSTAVDETLKEMTARQFSEWNIGRDYAGRGMLLLLADREKEVRIEVGSALEHVYTDLFTGHIENRQLPAYYVSGQLEIGMIALVEEIELRAQLMSKDEADTVTIGRLDQKFLSGGGGADVELAEFTAVEAIDTDRSYPAGRTPEEAWQTLIQSWRDKNHNPDIGVYTPVTRLIYRAFTSQPDSRFEEDVRTWGNKPYEIISNDTHAVVFFGKKKGWDNAPFLFCRTEEGWQFDMVYQRKIVRMGRAPAWGIERGEHPYIHLLSRSPHWMGQDMPIPVDEVYDVGKDRDTVALILDYESRLQGDGDDFETLLELGKLYTRTSMGRKRLTMLKNADSLQPDHPEVIKYLAISHVDAHYQYQNALDLMERYVHLKPEDPFGHFFRGYLLLKLKRPKRAIQSLEGGLDLAPDDLYGLCKLARAHKAMKTKAHTSDAEAILTRVTEIDPDHIRVTWLKRALGK